MATHVIEINERVLHPGDGLLLGNGDISVSVYQTADRIIWRFGKGDVWDRRLDLGEDPAPARIEEVARGIRDEGWRCGPYGGPVEATRGTSNPKRMKELCCGSPPSYHRRPYPCPKPVGELSMQLPPDQSGLKISQRLVIEEARIDITCAWPSGVAIGVESFIPPSENVLCLKWKLEGWDERTRTHVEMLPVWFTLYRWADPHINTFAENYTPFFRNGYQPDWCNPESTPLPPPSVSVEGSLAFIEQVFPPDPLFTEGFRYRIAPFALQARITPVKKTATREAYISIEPHAGATGGWLVLAVASNGENTPDSKVTPTGSGANAGKRIEEIHEQLVRDPESTIGKWRAENRESAAEFWSKSSVSISDPLLENLWYETLHAKRCAYRADTVPPGLFLPSTVPDYSQWHGDYHTNYNIQEPFWGDYTANHVEMGDAYFQAIKYFLPVGRKIARDYYGCRGVFIQLTGYPILAADDPLGVVPMGRMAYMTGWTANQYWWRYLYTMDEEWLRREGYPVIRDCALFYTDFMKKGDDGLYHIFPSNQGEDGFTGKPENYTDRPQVMQHARYCLRAAARASEILGLDSGLRAVWTDRLENCAGDDGKPARVLNGREKEIYEKCAPEFSACYSFRLPRHNDDPWPAYTDYVYAWYFGHYPWLAMQYIRSGEFRVEKDFPRFRELIERWRQPNGLIRAMAVSVYGHCGAWTESLGVIAPLQEMMLQSWDGIIRVFPAWPANIDASFENLRAEGAFLVSATWSGGCVKTLEIESLHGCHCRVLSPWENIRVVDKSGVTVAAEMDVEKTCGFRTEKNKTYLLSPA